LIVSIFCLVELGGHRLLAGPEASAVAGKSAGNLDLEGHIIMGSLRLLYRLAAERQFLGQSSIQDYMARSRHLENAAKIYVAMLVMADRLPEPANGSADAAMLSRIYLEIAVFSSETNFDGYLRIDSPKLIAKALELDPGNSLAWYEMACLYRKTEPKGKDRDDKIMQACKKAIAIDHDFPEAWLEMTLAYGRSGDAADSDAARQTFLDTLQKYKPELHFFDSGYPQVNETIGFPGNTTLKRGIYRTDDARFDLYGEK